MQTEESEFLTWKERLVLLFISFIVIGGGVHVALIGFCSRSEEHLSPPASSDLRMLGWLGVTVIIFGLYAALSVIYSKRASRNEE